MKKLKSNSQIAFVLLLLFTAFSCTKQEKKPSVEADIAAINELYKQATRAVKIGDVELYMSNFAEDVVVMPSEAPAATGKEELRPIYEALFDQFDSELLYTVEEVEVSGDWAVARSSFQFSMTLKEGGETITRAGKELDFFKKGAGGSWKTYIQSWNYNAPLVVE
jgi:uncharacterized protein (TIGR02246 family)